MSISPIFNMADLSPYQGTFEPPVFPSSVSVAKTFTPISDAPFTLLKLSNEILDVLDDKFVTSHSGGYHCFLIR